MWLAAILFLCILGLFAYLDTRKPRNFPPGGFRGKYHYIMSVKRRTPLTAKYHGGSTMAAISRGKPILAVILFCLMVGPQWLPVLGSALAVHRLRKRTGYLYEATAELARQYGPVVGLKVGKDRTVVLCGYDGIKDMLSREEFDGRPQGPFYETRTWGIRRGVLLTDAEFWQEQRRFVLRHLREFGFGRRTMGELIEAEAGQMVRMFREKLRDSPGPGAVVSMHDVFGVYVLNTLWSMMAGIRYSPDDLELKKLQGLLTELFTKIDMVGCMFSHFPVLRFLAPELSGYKQFLYIHQKLWEFLKVRFLKNELEIHKSTFRPNDARDFMDVYLEMLGSEQKKSSFSESQLLAICMDMFMAGSETTSKSLGFGFLYLLLFPEVQKRAQAEIDAVVGRDRLPSLNDRPHMPYMEAMVLESVRMFMGRTFSIPHRAVKDTTLQGYNIPKDTMVICNFNGTLMNKMFWGDPENFRPERFLDEDGKVVIPDYYTPFGFGKHRCMGETLAKSNVFLFMAALLQNFTFSTPVGTMPPSTEAVDGVTPSPRPFQALVLSRTIKPDLEHTYGTEPDSEHTDSIEPDSEHTYGTEPDSEHTDSIEPDSEHTDKPDSEHTYGTEPDSEHTYGTEPDSEHTYGTEPDSEHTYGTEPDSEHTYGTEPDS
uniref:Cytochrome P450 n=1 Tax=Timema genevievae TaxID=629358 RepID=A0A7R9JTQ1_TIMGE|nr:unnamed protein product [Timema genevievae]